MTVTPAFPADSATLSPAPMPAFALLAGDAARIAGPDAQPLPPGGAADLGARLAAAFAETGPCGIVGGTLPFDTAAADALWLSRQWSAGPLAARTAPEPVAAPGGWTLREEPPGADYAASVAAALRIIGTGALRKLVLARSLTARAPAPIDLAAVLARLALDPAAAVFLARLPGRDGGPRHLVGATPELLVRKRGAQVASHPLAGSRPRAADPGDDRAAAAALARSDKDRREHALVVEFILDTLAPLCRTLDCPEGTRPTATRSMWHLGTRIAGELRDPDLPAALIAAALHPTPAVCGLPRDRAAAEIARLEPVPRGFYAGAVGWCGADGDGDWFVAIRCAELAGRAARLFAGAGIVAGSDPEAERAETQAKFAALLAGLGLPPAETGGTP
ncbi:isochorismate synthase [Frigidibacter oleivorans]|uniref:isochorismate synthase n=1 Tax=Frigidibacter oleivorans TaxID=2487129 RepID=UPI000F8DDED2|nr:isochorismate synthase [Frigidibacter oleivorans]